MTVLPGEAIGLVGRTGAGKSSLLLALARMVPYTGYIKVDGVDIRTVPPKLLRSRISFVPQAPILFSGTLRSNIDPGGSRSDAEIYQVLQMCKLEEVIRALPQVKLTHSVPSLA